jgi:(S)-2-hydroxy-acid oxidase
LPDIIEVIDDKIPVLLDGGIRQGTDILKALALGAKMVLLGRPIIYGLAVNGQKGLEDLLNILKKEFDIAMCLTGCKSVKDISREMIVHESKFAKL